ncbi:epoxyqueuosine reductase [Sinanaerobacter chloroacetimidivorans]|jgi:epoxyqueuosine reductase|uniref:Epoxyqueuosine reductase n=1 Tax=Sinanaerobacter chloroacetimidivorans TaxID=2818044 RepID=A0A8J8B0L2_9FIRM|nr:epoxyqueuosine reductase [Sinanaerobacter chloroacetimidivorans]MBR0597294.1 epoxyqueuosine reductase [Sinanaerobacter chloroacetimidivorans]
MTNITNHDLTKIINEIYDSLEKNNFSTLGRPDSIMYERPLVGIAAGDDPYYVFLKEHIGEFHWSPEEAFRLKYPGDVDKHNLRVISIVFPQTLETKQSQSRESKCPSREWIVTRGEWEPLMKEFSGKLVEKLDELGIRNVSFDLLPEFKTVKSGKLGIASKWSHRHSAYAAGLGTFGLSEGLITERGKAVRITSFIIEAPLQVTERTYQTHTEWCLYYKDGSCGVCMKRCPVHAISNKGHDKIACEAYEEEFAEKYWPEGLDRGDYILGCGLCQAGIPCQNKRP